MDTMKPTLFNLDVQTTEQGEQTVAEITIDGMIGEDLWSLEDDQNTKQRMRQQLREIGDVEADKILVNISSLGGDVDHGLAIHDLLAQNPATVETNVTGMTASAATIIAQAGDRRRISDNALYLVHRAWTIGIGNANDFEVLTSDLNTLDERISNIYAKRSDYDQDDFMELMGEANGDGIWLSADDAEEYGLVDEVYEPMKAAAAVDPQKIKAMGLPEPPEGKVKTENSFSFVAAGSDDPNLKGANSDQYTITFNITEPKESEDADEEPKESKKQSANAKLSRERAELDLIKLKQHNYD